MSKYLNLAAAAADGLVHYWPMNETSGSVVADALGGWDGELFPDYNVVLDPAQIASTIVAAPTGLGRDVGAIWTGPSASESTSDEYVPIQLPAPSFSITPLPQLSLRFRFYLSSNVPTADSYSDDVYLLLFGSAVKETSVALFDYSGTGAEVSFQAAGEYPAANVSSPFVPGEWHDVVIVGSSAEAKLYVDGSLILTGPGANNYPIYGDGSALPSFLGSAWRYYTNAGEGIYDAVVYRSAVDGIIQDVAVWNRAIDAVEVADLWAEGMEVPLVTVPKPVDAVVDAPVAITSAMRGQVGGSIGKLSAAVAITSVMKGYLDWTAKLDAIDLQQVYLLDITGAADGLEDLRIPVSSWQATSQADDRSSYLQAIIPAANDLLADIAARGNGDLVISKGFILSDGTTRTEEILRSSFGEFRYDRGPSRLTATVSGYNSGQASQTSSTRTLSGVRSINYTGGKYRVRCDIDLFLKPGMTVLADGISFQASYINYFVSNEDKFCEVSER